MRGYFGGEIPFADFCGNKIKEIAVSNDRESTLRFLLELTPREIDEYRYIQTDGDCCSTSWWADIIGAKSAYGGIVTNIKSLDLPIKNWGEEVNWDDVMSQSRSRQEEDKVYGFEITTDKGSIILAFRNSSNGYYGGWAYDVKSAYSDRYGWAVIESNDWRA